MYSTKFIITFKSWSGLLCLQCAVTIECNEVRIQCNVTIVCNNNARLAVLASVGMSLEKGRT